MERRDSVTDGGQVISLHWKDLSHGCAETNCSSMQNGGITFIFVDKETFSYTDSFFLQFVRLFQLLIKAKMICVLWNWEACGCLPQSTK